MIHEFKRAVLNRIGEHYRTAFLKRTVFIAITGSCGKTTAKELIAAVLQKHYRGKKNPGTCNTPYHVVRMILRTRPQDRYCVLELAVAAEKDLIPLGQSLSLIKPRIGVVTNIGSDHISLFGSLNAIAAAKGKLISALPADGTAVLNADDPLVLDMQKLCPGKVITFGLSPEAMFCAKDIQSDWPERLSLTVTHRGRSIRVRTQLCGSHWVPSVLAAMAVGEAMGIPLESAAEAIAGVAPVEGRMSPVIKDGITFIRDDSKCPLWTIPTAIEFLSRAKAKRKIVVIGTIFDLPGDPSRCYRQVADQLQSVADMVIFVGPNCPEELRHTTKANQNKLFAFGTVDELTSDLRTVLHEGDLVLVKGAKNKDRLGRLVASWDGRRTFGAPITALVPRIEAGCNQEC